MGATLPVADMPFRLDVGGAGCWWFFGDSVHHPLAVVVGA